MRVALGLFYADRAVVVFNWLGHKLLAMGKKQNPALPGDFAESHGFTEPCGHLNEMRSAPERIADIHALLLVVPENNLIGRHCPSPPQR